MPAADTPVQHTGNDIGGLFQDDGHFQPHKEPDSFLTAEEKAAEDELIRSNVQKTQSVEDDEEVNTVQEELEKEQEKIKKAKAEDEKPKPKVQEPPKQVPKPLPVDDKPEEPVANYQQAEAYYNHLYIHQELIKHNIQGYAQDGSNTFQILRDLAKNQPYEVMKLEEQARQYAQHNAKLHYDQRYLPYAHKQLTNRLSKFVNRIIEDVPDISEYIDDMDTLAPEYIKKYPELVTEPEKLIPLLYIKAKEKRLSVVVESAKNGKTKFNLEKGGAQRSKATGKPPDRSEEKMDSMINSLENSKLDGFFGKNI